MILQGQVGPQQLGAGVTANVALGKGAEVSVSEYQGRYYQLAYAGKIFSACLQAGVALSTLSATATGFILTNTLSSGINLALLQVSVAVTTAPAGIANMHFEGTRTVQSTAVTQTTPLVVFSNLLGGNSIGVGLAASAATLPVAPVALRALGGGPNATGSVTTPFIVDDIAGSFIIGPGCYMNLGYLTTAISVLASFHWSELPQ
jgi:hypothetical protein